MELINRQIILASMKNAPHPFRELVIHAEASQYLQQLSNVDKQKAFSKFFEI